MIRRLTGLLAALLVVAAAPGCKRDKNDPERTEKVIDEVKDKAAEARSDIQEKQEALVENQGDSAQDRASFIDATEKELADLDRRIQEVRAHVQQRSNDLGGQAKRDLNQDLAELEATRDEARAALDRLRAQTGAQMSQIQQVTEEAMSKLRRAVLDADKRLDSSDSENGNQKSQPSSPARTPTTPPATEP